DPRRHRLRLRRRARPRALARRRGAERAGGEAAAAGGLLPALRREHPRPRAALLQPRRRLDAPDPPRAPPRDRPRLPPGRARDPVPAARPAPEERPGRERRERGREARAAVNARSPARRRRVRRWCPRRGEAGILLGVAIVRRPATVLVAIGLALACTPREAGAQTHAADRPSSARGSLEVRHAFAATE